MPPSVHDNLLVSYFVDAENKEICLHTKYPRPEGDERTDIVFTGVAAYYFEADNLMTILFGVEETTLEKTYLDYKDVFEQLRSYAWPNTGCENKEELLACMQTKEVRAYEISSSLGLTGFVWAQNMTLCPKSD